MCQQIEIRHLNEAEDWQKVGNGPIQWTIMPERRDLAEFLRSQGYCMIDRTIRATISLQKRDFSRFCRIPLEQMSHPEERIKKIAESSFLLDSRFFACASAKTEEIKEQIDFYVRSMGAFHICRCKNEIAGFLEIAADEENAEKQAVIRLAAVDEAYRIAGAALSLYAGAADFCRLRGLQRLWGRISSRNMAVMNLYATLGAAFSLPQDVYVKG